jgi:hypothetical protein
LVRKGSGKRMGTAGEKLVKVGGRVGGAGGERGGTCSSARSHPTHPLGARYLRVRARCAGERARRKRYAQKHRPETRAVNARGRRAEQRARARTVRAALLDQLLVLPLADAAPAELHLRFRVADVDHQERSAIFLGGRADRKRLADGRLELGVGEEHARSPMVEDVRHRRGVEPRVDTARNRRAPSAAVSGGRAGAAQSAVPTVLQRAGLGGTAGAAPVEHRPHHRHSPVQLEHLRRI